MELTTHTAHRRRGERGRGRGSIRQTRQTGEIHTKGTLAGAAGSPVAVVSSWPEDDTQIAIRYLRRRRRGRGGRGRWSPDIIEHFTRPAAKTSRRITQIVYILFFSAPLVIYIPRPHTHSRLGILARVFLPSLFVYARYRFALQQQKPFAQQITPPPPFGPEIFAIPSIPDTPPPAFFHHISQDGFADFQAQLGIRDSRRRPR